MVSRKTAARVDPVVLDSSCWLEYFSGSARADLYAEVIGRTATLVVPMITLYEVYKVALREFGEGPANQAVALMREGRVIDIGLSLTLSAAANGLPMADSLIYAAAQAHQAILWTQDKHFKGLPGVRYLSKGDDA